MARVLRTLTVIAFIGSAAMATNCGSDDFDPGSNNPDGGGGSGGAAGSSGSSGSSGSAGSSGTAGSSSDGGAKDPNGTACTDAGSCQSGNCVDGVCCDTACDGECEGCAADASKGTCTPHASGDDPESECPGDGTCADGKQIDPACDGAGKCAPVETSCGDYACGATACKTECAAAADCASTAWCDGTVCKPKKASGEACSDVAQCTDGFCEGGYCCGGVCAAPQTCASGTCKCNGATCTGGATCITWYIDSDGDGHGVSSSSNVLGCSNQPPTIGGKPGAQKAGDCDDSNKDAFPGQTAYFNVPRGNGSYDYNCDGAQTKQYNAISGSCQTCGVLIANVCTTCLPGGAIAVGSGYNCKLNCGGPSATVGYKTATVPNCGVAATLYSCKESGALCASAETSTANVKQPCN